MKAQSGKSLTAERADLLLDEADNVINTIKHPVISGPDTS